MRLPGPMSYGEIILVRHGETDWSRSHRHTGRTDIPLTEAGEQQARAAGEALADRSFSVVLCSPLSRAKDTCRLAGLAGEHVEYVDDLMEWDYGAAEGRSTADMQTEIPGWTVWTHPVGGDGESVEQVGDRADAVVARLLEALEDSSSEGDEAGGDVAVVAHGHMLRILTARWLGLPPVGGKHFALGTATLSALAHEHDNRVVRVWNDDAHLRRRP